MKEPIIPQHEIDDEAARWAKRPTWELRNVKKALSLMSWNNSREEWLRLAAVTQVLKEKAKGNGGE